MTKADKTLEQILAIINDGKGSEVQMSEEPKEAATEVKLATMVTSDGVTLESDTFAVGDAVYILQDGERIPAPEGDHTLEDGTILSLDAQGVILEVKAPGEPGEEEAPVEAPAADTAMTQEGKQPKSIIETKSTQTNFSEEQVKEMESIKTQLSEITSELETIKAENEALKGQKVELTSQVEELKAQLDLPVAEPKHTPEKKAPTPISYHIAAGRKETTLDRVMAHIASAN